jgi:hypothetical protein
LLDEHQVIILETCKLARRAVEIGDDGSNDFLVRGGWCAPTGSSGF